jgi:hypothetical protein
LKAQQLAFEQLDQMSLQLKAVKQDIDTMESLRSTILNRRNTQDWLIQARALEQRIQLAFEKYNGLIRAMDACSKTLDVAREQYMRTLNEGADYATACSQGWTSWR